MIRMLIDRLKRATTTRNPGSPLATRARRRARVAAVSRIALISLAAIAVVGFVILLLGPVANWATVGGSDLQGKEKADAITATRQILLAAAGGTAVLVGLGFTARTYYLSRRGQFTDRYTKALIQLASDKLTERLGGIYALEHLMRESEADHVTVVDVLAAFIRENTPASSTATDEQAVTTNDLREHSTHLLEPRPKTDIQAALTVLARRPRRPEPDDIDLSRSDLRGADLRWARLEHARLQQTWLQYANLSSAHLKGAHLRDAQLQHAWLVDAHMDDADLIDTQLEQANLGGAQLRSADLRRAQLRQAQLYNADLSNALLSGACLEDANLTDACIRDAHLAGGQLSGRVRMKSIGYHSKEKARDEDLGGTQLTGANLARAQLQGADLVGHQRAKPAPAQGLTAAQLAKALVDETTKLSNELRTALVEYKWRQRESRGI